MPDDDASPDRSDEQLRPLNGTDRVEPVVRDPLVGTVLTGRFEIIDLIARGGMGKVYRARQQPLGRVCALKVLDADFEGDEEPEFRKRFFLEASTAAKLSHPNTVTIFDYGRDGDIYFIAMEYVEGRTLRQILCREGPLPELRVAHILRAVCLSLREAHEHGVIHRDIKPGNIAIIDRPGDEERIKVLDFGLAKRVATEEGEELTGKGLVMGSPKYMAPEQILGEPVSPRTDIYALGVVAFELLTGQVPFDCQMRVQTLMAHLKEPPPSLDQIRPSLQVSPAMRDLVYRCLRKDPQERFSNTSELVRALSYVDGGSGPLGEPVWSTRTPAVDAPSGPLGPEPPAAEPSISDQTTVTLSQPPATDDLGRGSRVETDGESSGTGPPATPDPMAQSVVEPIARSPRRRRSLALAAAAVIIVVVVALTVGRGGEAPDRGLVAGNASIPATGDPALAPAAQHPAARTVRIESDPPGAAVREGDELRCRATPCEVSWRGGQAAGAVQHVLRLSKDGYAPAELVVSPTDTDRTVTLRPLDHGAPDASPAVTGRPTGRSDRVGGQGSRTQKEPAKATTTAPTTSGGYKDSPY